MLSVFFLYQEIGPSVFVGLGGLVLLVPFSGILAMKQGAFQADQLQSKDKRIKILHEMFSGIKVSYFKDINLHWNIFNMCCRKK